MIRHGHCHYLNLLVIWIDGRIDFGVPDGHRCRWTSGAVT